MNPCLSRAKNDELPPSVVSACRIDWGVPIDAYLADAARVGNRFAASVYLDGSGVCANGATVVTPPLRRVTVLQGFEMFQSLCGADHYVVVTRLKAE